MMLEFCEASFFGDCIRDQCTVYHFPADSSVSWLTQLRFPAQGTSAPGFPNPDPVVVVTDVLVITHIFTCPFDGLSRETNPSQATLGSDLDDTRSVRIAS